MNDLNKEKIKANVCQIGYCDRLTHKESKYCIFHASAEEKTEEEFKEALKKYIEEIKKSKKGEYNFSHFIFLGGINFKEEFKVSIFKNANFNGAIFKGEVNFGETTFKGDASFGDATFEGRAYFFDATFKGRASFWDATFKGYNDFKDTTFNDIAGFEGATFKGEASFFDATFKDKAWFMKATFKDNACFKLATFEDNANFELAILPQGKVLSLKVRNSGIISFNHTFLENVDLELDLEKEVFIDFTNARLRNTQIEKEEIDGHILQEQERDFLGLQEEIGKDFFGAKEIYLLLKNNFYSIGRYDDESWAFKKEKDMERKNYFHYKSLHKWLWSCFLNGIFGYGEQPGKVIISAISIILIFTFLFMSSGISDTSIGGFTSNNFLDCVYFSVITFTTLGYGDFRPLEGCSRIFAGTEAFIGALMMALFVYTFARRTGGR